MHDAQAAGRAKRFAAASTAAPAAKSGAASAVGGEEAAKLKARAERFKTT